MILTGSEIQKEVQAGHVVLSPYYRSRLNPNSYNYRIGPILKIASGSSLDAKQEVEWQEIEIPEEGFVLQPGTLYLGSTLEVIGSTRYVPSLIGRSSLGRLGMFLQASADLGNLGAIHSWTLEIKVVQRLRIYAGMDIGQVSFWKPFGRVFLYEGVYDQFSHPTPSQRLFTFDMPGDTDDLDRSRNRT